MPNNVIMRIVSDPPKQFYAAMDIRSGIEDATQFLRAWIDKSR